MACQGPPPTNSRPIDPPPSRITRKMKRIKGNGFLFNPLFQRKRDRALHQKVQQHYHHPPPPHQQHHQQQKPKAKRPLHFISRSDIWLGLFTSSTVATVSLYNTMKDEEPRDRTDVEKATLGLCSLSMIFSFALGAGLRLEQSKEWLTTSGSSSIGSGEKISSLPEMIYRGLSKTVIHSSPEMKLSIVMFVFWCCIAGYFFNPEHSLSTDSRVVVLDDVDESSPVIIWNNNLYFATWASYGLACYLICDLMTRRSSSLNMIRSRTLRRKRQISRAWALLLIASTTLFSFCVANMNASDRAGEETNGGTEAGAVFGLLGGLMCVVYFTMQLLSKTSFRLANIITKGRKKYVGASLSFAALVFFATNIAIDATSPSMLVGSVPSPKLVYSCNEYFASLICLGLSVFLALRYYALHRALDEDPNGQFDNMLPILEASRRRWSVSMTESQSSVASSSYYGSEYSSSEYSSDGGHDASSIEIEQDQDSLEDNGTDGGVGSIDEVSAYPTTDMYDFLRNSALSNGAQGSRGSSGAVNGSRASNGQPKPQSFHNDQRMTRSSENVMSGRVPPPPPPPRGGPQRARSDPSVKTNHSDPPKRDVPPAPRRQPSLNGAQDPSVGARSHRSDPTRSHRSDPSVRGSSAPRGQDPSATMNPQRFQQSHSYETVPGFQDPSVGQPSTFDPSICDGSSWISAQDPSLSPQDKPMEPSVSYGNGRSKDPSVLGSQGRHQPSFHQSYDPVSSSDQESRRSRGKKQRGERRSDPVSSSSDQESPNVRGNKQRSQGRRKPPIHVPSRAVPTSKNISFATSVSSTPGGSIDPFGSLEEKAASYLLPPREQSLRSSKNSSSSGVETLETSGTMHTSGHLSADKQKAVDIAYNAIYLELKRREGSFIGPTTSPPAPPMEKRQVKDAPKPRPPKKPKSSKDRNRSKQTRSKRPGKESSEKPQNSMLEEADRCDDSPHHADHGAGFNVQKKPSMSGQNPRSTSSVMTDDQYSSGVSVLLKSQDEVSFLTNSITSASVTSATLAEVQASDEERDRNRNTSRRRRKAPRISTVTEESERSSNHETSSGDEKRSSSNSRGKAPRKKQSNPKKSGSRKENSDIYSTNPQDAEMSSQSLNRFPPAPPQRSASIKSLGEKSVTFQLGTEHGKSSSSRSLVPWSQELRASTCSEQSMESNYDRSLDDLMCYVEESEARVRNKKNGQCMTPGEVNAYYSSYDETNTKRAQQHSSSRKQKKLNSSSASESMRPQGFVHNQYIRKDSSSSGSLSNLEHFRRNNTNDSSAITGVNSENSPESLFDHSLDHMMHFLLTEEDEGGNGDDDMIMRTIREAVSSTKQKRILSKVYDKKRSSDMTVKVYSDRRTSDMTSGSMYAC